MEDKFKAWQVATAEYGLTIKRDDYFLLEGMPPRDFVLFLFQDYGRKVLDVDKVVSLK